MRKGQAGFDARIQQHIPPGCKLGLDGTIMASTGIPSLDALLGEGLPSGRFLLLLEDEPRSTSNYANTMLKCFIAEGLLSGQDTLFIGSDTEKMLGSLPAPSSKVHSASQEPAGGEKMTIAWRYRHLQTEGEASASPAPRFGHTFDLGKRLDTSQYPPVTVLNADEAGLGAIRALVDAKRMTRIAIQGLASPLMFEGTEEAVRWLYALKQIILSSNAIVMATIPSHLHSLPSQRALFTLPDSILVLQSFLGTAQESAPAFKDYQGFLRIVRPLRLPCSLALAIPESADLAFKCKQRRFVIEKFHLPPELGDAPDSGCSTTAF